MSIHDTRPSARERRFTDLFAETYPAVVRFVERRVPPSHAEDVAAEVFLVLWRRLDDIPADAEDARAWLFGVARRTLMPGGAASDDVRRSPSASPRTDPATHTTASTRTSSRNGSTWPRHGRTCPASTRRLSP
jgi:RNA polymerase sigma-70 factor (ECF subfamily)